MLGSSRRRSGSRRLSPRLSPRLGRSSPPAGSGSRSGSGSGSEGAVSSTGPRDTQRDNGDGDAHSGTSDSATSCHPQLPSVACGAPRGAESCSSLKAPSWARHSSLLRLLGLTCQALVALGLQDGLLSRSGPSCRLRCGRESRPKSPILRRSTHRSWRSTRGRAMFSPPRLVLEHGAPPTRVPPSLAGDSCGKLAELMRCCDGLQELM